MAEARQPIVNLRQIEFDDIRNREIVGRGSFGTVYKALWQNRYVAVKEFYVTADQKAIQTEVKQLSRVVHPNIIALYGVSIKNESVYLVMEYAEGGSLYNFLHGKANPYYSAAHAMNWALQCAEGVAYLHAMKPKPLIHRDLKPPNLLLVNFGRNLKICDFGTAADKSTWMTNNQGSAAWMAPEVFEGSHYSEKCDVFSWGIILWELLSRQQPFKEVQHALTILWGVHKGNRPPIIEGCPKPIEDLYTSCWSREPSERPSMQHVVEIMTILCDYFPGADLPLDCKDPLNQQPSKEHSETDATIDNTRVSFSPWSSLHSSQKTPTNSESVRHLANMFNNLSNANSPNSPSKRSPRFSPSVSTSTLNNNNNNNSNSNRTPDEKPDSWSSSFQTSSDPFRLKPSQETANRNETIRNGILKRGNLPMTALSVDIDPNAWALKNDSVVNLFENTSKTDNKQRLTVTETKPVIHEDDDDEDDDDDRENACSVDDDYAADQSLHQMLDPSLQPELPIPNNRLSQEIYQDHTRLAKEYLRVDTELYYATDRRDKYLASLDPIEREQKMILMKKLEEKEELLELYNDLKQQLERIRAAQAQQTTSSTSAQITSSADPQTSRSVKVLQSQISSDSLAADPADDGWVLIPTKESNT
ncbi:mitogen-activated protein kinase kinase kinase 7 [Episyrphus balteatus]|uniref:mitogen-activated protein kinase kinase kinase 7 n=1 Tax=Episyrphus balteatus TaxID=286459 RepID=UPI002486B45A|nr:mitogen-activated protein kinase kinase kinase 7 [Episyrphus balteatus]